MKPVLVTCLSLGGSLSASLSGGSVNLPFAILAAVLGTITLLWTSMPREGDGTGAADQPRFNSIVTGISTGAISFILIQFMSGAIGFGLSVGFSNLGIQPDDRTSTMLFAGLATGLVLIKIPFDLMLGANLLSQASRIHIGLIAAFVVYAAGDVTAIYWAYTLGLLQYFDVGQIIMGDGLSVVITVVGLALGAYGVRLAGLITRRNRPRTAVA